MTRDTLSQALEEARPKERRGRMLMVRMTDGERARLAAAAKRQGIPAAALARVLIFTGLDELEELEKGGPREGTFKKG